MLQRLVIGTGHSTVMHIVVTMGAKSWSGWLVDGLCRMIMHGDGDYVAW